MKSGTKTAIGIIAATLIGAGGYAILNNDNTDSSAPANVINSVRSGLQDDDYTTERSFEEFGDRDCGDFSSQSEAQAFFEAEGGPFDDYHGLDRDGDGIACESI